MEQITLLRNAIDAIDDQIMALLEERFNTVCEIGALKKVSHQAVLDAKREQVILNKIKSYAQNEAISQVYLTILEASKSLQRKG